MRSILGLPGAFLLLLLAPAAPAATVNFEALAPGNLGTNRIKVDGVVFKAPHGLFNASAVHFPGKGGAICAFHTSPVGCEYDLTIDFKGSVKNLTFRSAGFDSGDDAIVQAFRRKRLIAEAHVLSNMRVDFRGLGKITRVEIDDRSTGAGFVWGLFNFKRVDTAGARPLAAPAPVTAPVAAVPLPAAAGLLAGALALVGALGLRRRG